MERIISGLNGISLLFLVIIAAILIVRVVQKKQWYTVLLLVAFVLLMGVTITNILEHLGISLVADTLEDFFEIMFMPFIIFSVLNTMMASELAKRTLSEEKFKALFNHAFSFFGLLDKNGNVIETNKTACDFINVPSNKFAGQPFAETDWWTHSRYEQDRLVKAIELASKGETIRFETTHYDDKGVLHYVDFSLKPVVIDGQIRYLIPEGRDMTEIVEARKELEKHRNHLEILVKERTEELESMNEEIRAINEEIYDKNLDLIKANQTLSDQKLVLEKTLKDLHEAQQQLIDSEKMVSIGVLSAGIAHEINNPVNFINSGVIGLTKSIEKAEEIVNAYLEQIYQLNNPQLLEQIAQIDARHNKEKYFEAIKVLLKHIETGVIRVVEIVNSLKFFVRSDSDSKIQVDVHDIIDSVLIILHNEYKYKAEIIKQYNLNVLVNCVVGKINQVVMNILSNAIQAIEQKGTITIKTYTEGQYACISISDTGKGILPDIKAKIFEPFFTTKPIGKGTGLGLSISFKIIQEHDGQIIVNSELNKGAEFIVKLPLQ